MKDILLIVAQPLKKEEFINILPHLGVLGLASFLEKKGFSVDVIDQNIGENLQDDFSEYFFVGFSVNCANKKISLKLAESIKNRFPAIKVIFGGPEATGNPLDYIHYRFIDFVIVGEGEKSLCGILKNLPLERIKGALYKKNGQTIFNKKTALTDIESLPFPAFNKVQLSQYYSPIKKCKNISSIITSRGCPYSCIFCFNHLGRKWRPRSPQSVVDEMQWQIKNFGVREFIVYDDNFSLDLQRAEEICDLILQKGLNIYLQFQNGLRCDHLTKELLIKMKRAGCWLVAVAPETGSEKTLKLIKKNQKLEKVNEVVQWCKEIGIATYSFFMLGFPWETKEDILATIRFAQKLDTDLVQFSRVTPFPNTELARYIRNKNNEIGDNLFSGSNRFSLQDVSEKEFDNLIKCAYRYFYLRPKKIWGLFRLLKIRDILNLGLFSIRSKNL